MFVNRQFPRANARGRKNFGRKNKNGSPVRYVRTRSIYNALQCIALRRTLIGNQPRGDDDFINIA